MKKETKILLKLSTILIPFVLLFCTGLILTVIQSFGFIMYNQHYDKILFAYREIFLSRWFYDSFIFSIYTALTSALISVILGTILAYLIWKLPFGYQKYTIFYKIPLILPHITAAFIILILFSKTGFLSSIFFKLELITDQNNFPSLLYQKNGFDIITSYIFKETPFVILLVSSSLSRFDRRMIDTAKMLGANWFKYFFRIIIPYLFPVINTSLIILFIYSFGAFDIPFVLGQSYPGMISIHIYKYFFKKDLYYRPIAMALLTIVFVFSIIFIYIYSTIIKKLDITERKI